MLSDKKGRQLDLYVPDYVVFDLETTGISAAKDDVVEISAVRVKNGAVDDEFSTLVNPERPIPWEASRVNNITDEMVADAPLFCDALADFLDFAGGAVLVGHNIAAFDMKFLYRDAQRYWGAVPGNDYADTLPLSRQLLPQLAHHRLVDLADYYGFSTLGAHRALNDCRMNQMVYEELGRELKKLPAAPACPACGRPMKKRTSRFGPFWGCSGYPECRKTINIKE